MTWELALGMPSPVVAPMESNWTVMLQSSGDPGAAARHSHTSDLDLNF